MTTFQLEIFIGNEGAQETMKSDIRDTYIEFFRIAMQMQIIFQLLLNFL